MYQFDPCEIQQQVLNFCIRVDLCPRNNNFSFILDGNIHRFSIIGDKHGQVTGAYCFFTDGWPAG